MLDAAIKVQPEKPGYYGMRCLWLHGWRGISKYTLFIMPVFGKERGYAGGSHGLYDNDACNSLYKDEKP